MDFKQFFINLKDRIVEIWSKGTIQKTSRVTYDVFSNLLLFFIVIGAMVLFFAGGAGAGYFASLVKDEPIRSYEDMRKDIYNYEETSKLYFANNKYIGDIRSDLHREEIELEDVSELVIQAVLATEDQLFYEHNGIVPKAIVRALYQEVANSDARTGGSTLTQQLIKNQILTNEVSFERKAKEILLAMRLENFFEKDEILEAYLNIIPYGREASGRNIAGIQTAAKGVFGVEASELNLPQAAFLSGIPQNPYAYTPFLNTGEIKEEESLELGLNRMKTVLKRMYQNDFITEEEYDEALEYDIVADFTEKSDSSMEKYPAIVFELEKRAKEIIMEIIANEDGYIMDDLLESEELFEQYEILADRALRMNGYNIHSTIDKEMYDTMQEVVQNYEYYGPSRTYEENVDGETVQITEEVENGVVLIENKTGKILSFVPGRNYSIDNQVNFATLTTRSPGSTFKPLAAYAPGMEIGAIQPGSVIADIPTSLGGYEPKNYGGAIYGLVSAREAMSNSYNISSVKFYNEIVHEKPAEKYLSKLGFSKLTEGDKEYLSLPLGGMDHGVTVEENTNAFATFANGGKFVDSYMIEKITTNDGEVIYEHEPEPVEVLSPQTSYLTLDMMRDAVRSGTAAYLPSQLNVGGVDWAGKTGTSQGYDDAWFIGTNPNITMGSWIGYEHRGSVYCSGCSLTYHQRNIKLWAQIINSLAEIDPELITPKESFKQPDGLVRRSYCAVSGLLPSKVCQEAGLVQSDLYNAKFVPTEEDDSLVGGNMPLVEIDGETVVAGPNTPVEFTVEEKGGFAFNPEFLERMEYDKLSDLSILFPRRNRELWEKISFDGAILIDEKDNREIGKPSPPNSLSADENNVAWNYKKGEMIVGYRIYYASEKGKSFKLIDHTIQPSFTIPNQEGVYHIRAVNYYGEESEPSKEIIVESEKEEPDKRDKDKDEDKDKKPPRKPDKDNEKNNNGGNNNSDNGDNANSEEPDKSDESDEDDD